MRPLLLVRTLSNLDIDAWTHCEFASRLIFFALPYFTVLAALVHLLVVLLSVQERRRLANFNRIVDLDFVLHLAGRVLRKRLLSLMWLAVGLRDSLLNRVRRVLERDEFVRIGAEDG